MKTFCKVIVWALLSVIMQAAGLIYLEKVYFKETTDVKIQEVQQVVESKDLNISIPSHAEKIEASFDAKYISYYDQNKLMVVNTTTSVVKEVVTNDGTEILFSGWIPKQNILIIAEKKHNSDGDSHINLVSYNVKNDVKNQITEICPYSDGMEVDKIVSSIKTGVTYISVSRDGFNSQLYRVEINNNLSAVTKVPSMGDMMAYQHKDILVYEDSLNQEFYKYTNEKKSKINTGTYKNLTLLGVTNDNLLMFGILNNDKITNIVYGTLDTDIGTWTNLTLEKPKEKKDIFVNSNNEILINDNLTGKVHNLTTNKNISYEGKFIKLTEKAICSLSEGKVYLKSLEDIDEENSTDATSTVSQ